MLRKAKKLFISKKYPAQLRRGNAKVCCNMLFF